MMGQQPACMGCFVNNPNMWSPPPENPMAYWIENLPKNVGLTPQEKMCLEHLAQAWNIFESLEEKHPSDNAEFCTAIHDAQKMLALRVARRVDTNVWTQHP